jgi:predicted AlkP superfamily pyrophosphatase or phosphodiesterase
MKLSVRSLPTLLLLLLQTTPGLSGAEKPKLVLAITIDQFRYDYLTRFRSDYHAGLARLVKEGIIFTDAHHIHFPTVTALGHSTFLSGATPSVSGIISNDWYDPTDAYAMRETKGMVSSVMDSSEKLIGGVPGAVGSSPRRMLVSTFGDELKMAGKASKVIGISMKDRSSILPSGHMADAAYWFDPDSNHFVTSTYYMKQLPEWVAKVNADRPISNYLGAEWLPVDAKPGTRAFCSMAAGGDLPFCGALEATPFGNELLEGFVERAIDREDLGKHPETDVLAMSFSANDYAGHALGPDAPQIRDISIRTDRLLGKLMDFIDSRIGKGNTLVVLTSDHGVAPVPEVNNRRNMPGGRLDAAKCSRAIGDALTAKFPPSPAQAQKKREWFASDAYGFIYLNPKTIAGLNAAEVRRVAAEAARKLPHIARVFTRDELARGEGTSDPVGHAVLLGFYPPRWCDLVLLPEPYYMFADTGTTHSTPYDYDNHVPIIFFGPGIRSGVDYSRVAVNDIAPTLSALFEVETPSGSSGRILSQIFK